MKVVTTFGELKIGQAFDFRGSRYVKQALSCAKDARNWGCIFLYETVVQSEAESGECTEKNRVKQPEDGGETRGIFE